MRMGPIFLLVSTAAVAGWFAPGLKAGRDEASANLSKSALAEQQVSDARRQAWLAGGTVLDRTADGHFYADADVESARIHFLVDTGASVIVLTGDDARAAGLTWNDGDVQPIGRGASGPVYGVPVMLPQVQLDGFEARDVQAAIVPEGLDVSLLGQSFLSRLDGVKIEGDRMTLNAGD
jgi:clan AA aspartic protease, TIGR02281 family